MKKRTYRATAVKDVDVERLAEAVGDDVMFGMDAAKAAWFGAFVTPDQVVQLTIRWDVVSEQVGLQDLLEELGRRGCAIKAAVEATGTYAHAQVEQLESIGIPVYAVKVKHSHDYAEIYDGVPSQHDGKAAAVVAELALNTRNRKLWRGASSSERRLRAMTDWADWLQQDYQRYSNRMEAVLARYWPELTREVELDRVSTLSLLSEFGAPELVTERPDDAADLLTRTSRGALAEGKISAVLATARETIGVSMEPAERELTRRLASRLLSLRQKRSEAFREVERAAKDEPAVQHIAENVGAGTAAVLHATIGDFAAYHSVRALWKGFGINLKERSSGNHQGQLKITKRGSSRARRWLFLAALRWLKDDRIAKAWYLRKVARDGGKKMKAIVALMRKLTAGLYHVARGARFDSTKLFNVRRLRLPA